MCFLKADFFGSINEPYILNGYPVNFTNNFWAITDSVA